MKKIFAITAVIAALTVSCSKDFLETDPTNAVKTNTALSDVGGAMSVVNGMYRAMYHGGWGDGWEPENGGLPAYILVFDLYAEDHLMDDMGSGWFYYDYGYMTWSDYTHNASHSYQVWNFNYTLISNANSIIARKGNLPGDEAVYNNVIGQAYAIRANAYWWLANAFCFNGGKAGSASRSNKGVPIYTESTTINSEGKGRGTIQDTYNQINADIDSAIVYLEAAQSQQHISHIDKYVAYGLKSRFAMTQCDYETALTYAEKAMGSSASIADYTTGAPAINDAKASNVLWALNVLSDQVSYTIFEHMDADCNGTYSEARHLIGSWLYEHIPAGDGRLKWWTAPLDEEEWGAAGTKNGSKRSWCQKKLVFMDAASQTGDHILMRAEEIYLNAAESACHLQQYTKARQYIQALGEKRVSGYSTRLEGITDGYLPSQTTDEPANLLDEILLQRRIELWSEFPRIFDLQRLGLGFTRLWDGTSNHIGFETLEFVNTSAGSPNFILHIPDTEFDSNHAMSRAEDQNPDFE